MKIRGMRILTCMVGAAAFAVATGAVHGAPEKVNSKPESVNPLDDVLRWKSRQRIGITLPAVLRQALVESIDIEVDRYDPLIATSRVRSARGSFEPLFETSLNYTHRERILNEYDASSQLLIRGVQTEASRADQLEAARLSLSQSLASEDGGPSPSGISELDGLARQSNDVSRQLQQDISSVKTNLTGREFEEEFSVFRSQISQKLPTGTRL
jgi:hypothetical protein